MSQKWVMKWTVESRSGKPPYTVSLSVDGYWGCSCPNWIFRRNKPDYQECPHIQEKKVEMNWHNGNTTELLKLIAHRVEQLRTRGKDEKEIEKDLAITMRIAL